MSASSPRHGVFGVTGINPVVCRPARLDPTINFGQGAKRGGRNSLGDSSTDGMDVRRRGPLNRVQWRAAYDACAAFKRRFRHRVGFVVTFISGLLFRE